MSDEQLAALWEWLPASICECEIIALTDQAEKRFPDITPDNIARAVGRLYGIPI